MGRERVRPLWVCDCETDPFHSCTDAQCFKCRGEGRVPQPFIWGLYDIANEEYYEFTEIDEFVRFIRDRKILVYAHNGGKFDYHYLLPWINTDERIMLINGRLAKFRIGECEFRDSMNIIPVALAKYQKEKIDYSIFEPELRVDPRHWEAIRMYLRSDCRNLADLVEEFYKRYGSHLTQAGASMNYWSREFGVEKPKQTASEYARYKPYYYGGRVQCFQHGFMRKKFKVFDINSAYPFAMLAKHPFSTSAVSQINKRLPTKENVLKDCLIRVKGVSKGAFPLRYDQGLYFPEDERVEREFHVTGYEMLAALETNTFFPTDVLEVHRFTASIDFREYIMHFFNERKAAKTKGDKIGDLFAKWFMNSLYGKFGANPDNYSEYMLASTDSKVTHLQAGYSILREMPGIDGTRYLMERKLPEDKHRFYNVATAASVTGYVRAHLWRAILKCDGMIYCDTDSIVAENARGLSEGNELGQWKLEMQGDAAGIAGKKLYVLHKDGMPWNYDPQLPIDERSWKMASKGVQLQNDPLAVEKIIAAAQGEKIMIRPEVPTYSLKGGLPCFTNREIRDTFKDIRSVPA